jgi:hypothetical protein
MKESKIEEQRKWAANNIERNNTPRRCLEFNRVAYDILKVCITFGMMNSRISLKSIAPGMASIVMVAGPIRRVPRTT